MGDIQDVRFEDAIFADRFDEQATDIAGEVFNLDHRFEIGDFNIMRVGKNGKMTRPLGVADETELVLSDNQPDIRFTLGRRDKHRSATAALHVARCRFQNSLGRNLVEDIALALSGAVGKIAVRIGGDNTDFMFPVSERLTGLPSIHMRWNLLR